jgi:hypothetical protein
MNYLYVKYDHYKNFISENKVDRLSKNLKITGKEFINHIVFSDYSNNLDDEDNYERLLDRNEMVEILNRIRFILLDLVKDKVINNKFCIGGTKLEKKNNIYEFLLKVIVGENGFKKELTDIYNTGYGLYFEV